MRRVYAADGIRPQARKLLRASGRVFKSPAKRARVARWILRRRVCNARTMARSTTDAAACGPNSTFEPVIFLNLGGVSRSREAARKHELGFACV